MDSNISKALWLGVSILLFVAVVTIGLTVFGTMKDASTAANKNISSIAQNLSEVDFMAFDGKDVKGEQVLSAINDLSGRSGEVIVLVATLGSNGGTPLNLDPANSSGLNISNYTQYVSETDGTLSVDSKSKSIILSNGKGELLKSVSKTVRDAARRDAENSNLPGKYINPAGKFRSYLIYDTNNVIRGIICAQVE